MGAAGYKPRLACDSARNLRRAYILEAGRDLFEAWLVAKAWGTRLARRVGSEKARVALARKLAVLMHRVWIDGTEFRWSQEATTA